MTAAHRRRTATGHPPARQQVPVGRDGVPPPAGPDARQLDERPGEDVGEAGLPLVAAGPSWRPRPTSPQELDDARTALLVHRWDPDTGRCAACHGCCPCREAHAAARVLAQAGAWNTMPFTSPADWQTGHEPSGHEPSGRGPARTGGGWLTRLARRLSWTAAAR